MTQTADFEQNEIWMLFENGEAARVQLTLHKPPSESVIPADAFVITERAGLTRSARRAASVAFNWLNSSGREQEPFVAGFDLAGLSDGPVSGESGGLAFALALVASLSKQQIPAIAATGDITSGHGEGQVAAVHGIEEKLKSAAQILQKGSMIFYPLANDGDIRSSLREEIRQKGIALCGVPTVSKALGFLFPEMTSELPLLKKKHTSKFRVIGLSISALSLSILIFCWIFQSFTDKTEFIQSENLPVIVEKQEKTLTIEPVEEIVPVENTPTMDDEITSEIRLQPESYPPNNRGFE